MASTTEMQRVRIADIRPYENNAKIHGREQLEKLKASIKEFGFVNPCLIDRDYNLIAGHGRVMAATELGMESVPCVFVEGLTDAQRRAYILADNKLAELADWDNATLAQELADLQLDDFDITLTGFEIELKEENEIVEDEYQSSEMPEEMRTKIGDIYSLGRHRLICGDSTDSAIVEMLMDGAKANIVITDAPYGINVVNEKGKVGSDNLAKNGIYAPVIGDDTTDTARKAYNILSTICDKIILWGGNYFTDFLPFSDGWIIWDKRGESGIRNNFADGEMAWCNFHTPVRIYRQLWNGMIREGEHEKRVHPTQKPVRILCEILQDFSEENDVVVDVFGGSGSTMIACEQLKRRCYMMELDPHYCDVIIDRWEKFTGEKAELVNG